MQLSAGCIFSSGTFPGSTKLCSLGTATTRKYSNADFIHTLSDLAGLSYDRFRPEKSIVNPAFQPTTRWIGNPENKKDLRDFDAVVPVPPGLPLPSLP
ncbi:MAG: phosphoethanolamine transferase CptA [Zoogloeaceae bacterium]|jgi:hypothetical protein|nr:phosphoethanolamine transferase CptA [Zoogloeaceae bacterium]